MTEVLAHQEVKIAKVTQAVEERTVVGTTRYYAITQGGVKALSFLSAEDNKV